MARLLLGLLLLACGSPPDSTGPQPAENELGLPAGDESGFFPDRPLYKLRFGDTTRNALEAWPRHALSRRLEVARGSRIELAAGVACPPEPVCRGRWAFRVEETGEPVWERALSLPGDADQWHRETVALAA